MIALLYLIVTGKMLSEPYCESKLYRYLRPDDCPKPEEVPIVVRNVALPGLSMLDSEPGRMCRIVATRRADMHLGTTTPRAYFEIEGVPVDSNEPQRTYITNNIFILNDGTDAEYEKIVEQNFALESLELCTPEFGKKE